jgi:glycosyltransferase involved in cell wall biosynthesis
MPARGPITVMFVHGPPTFGGDSVVVFRTIQRLSPDFRPVLVVPPASAAWQRFSALSKQRPLLLVPLEMGVHDHLATDTAARRPGQDSKWRAGLLLARAVLRLFWLTVRERVDVVYTLDRSRAVLAATVVARLAGRGMILHAQSSWTGWKAAVQAARRVVVISHYVRREYERNGIPAEKIDVVHNGIDVEFFASAGDAAAALARLGAPAGTPLVMLPGRLSRYKGQLELVEAIPTILASAPAARFVFAGADTSELGDLPGSGGRSMRQVLEQRAAELGVAGHAAFLPASTEHEMADLYAAADVVVVPSWEEPFGLVVIEAMAAGTPVVGSTTGAIPEIIVGGESGLLVPPREPAALAGAITALLDSPDLRQRLGASAQARMRSLFTLERYSREFEAILRVVAGRRSAPLGTAP